MWQLEVERAYVHYSLTSGCGQISVIIDGCGQRLLITSLLSLVQTCRQGCGGHGYLRACGIPDVYVDVLPAVTYEGVNTILYLQTSR